MKKIILLSFFVPLFASAAGITDLIKSASLVVTSVLIPLAFSLCLLYFFWGVAKYIWSAGSEKDEGKSIMLWGIVGLFVAFSIWGIIIFVREELNIPDIQKIEKPR